MPRYRPRRPVRRAWRKPIYYVTRTARYWMDVNALRARGVLITLPPPIEVDANCLTVSGAAGAILTGASSWSTDWRDIT